MNTSATRNMMHTGFDTTDVFSLDELPQKLKGISEYKLKLPERIEMSELTIDIVKRKKLVIAEIREQNGRKSKQPGKLF
jgi:hypothetical protein